MSFSLAARSARACLAVALMLGATVGPAAGGSPRAGEPSAPAWAGMGSDVHARVLGELAAMAPERRLPYLRARAEGGESAVLLLLLAREEARQAEVAARAGDEAGARQRRAEAAGHGLAAYAVMRTAAPLCSDRTSPDEYLRELGEDLQPLLSWLGGQDPGLRQAVSDAALALEAKVNAPGRPDPMLCRRGLHGDRFCPPGPGNDACPPDAAKMEEFHVSEPLIQHQYRVRYATRGELKALAR